MYTPAEQKKRIAGKAIKTGLAGLVAVSLWMPFEAGAQADTSGTEILVQGGAASPSSVIKADPSKVKFTKDQAVAKLKELFPVLSKATVSRYELGVSNQYPPPANQMVWNIQWSYQTNDTTYGFNSLVDAITGDLISTNIFMPVLNNEAYYPPKLTREQALDSARAFLKKAVSSQAEELEPLDQGVNRLTDQALFGPVQYSFIFTQKKNGIQADYNNIYITVDGNGVVTDFTRPSDVVEIPAVKPVITQVEADKRLVDGMEAELVYEPIWKEGKIARYMLAWRPVEQALLGLDAVSGARLDTWGKEVVGAPPSPVTVPAGQKLFKPNTSNGQLTAEEAVQKVTGQIPLPKNRGQASPYLRTDYMDKQRHIWSLSWRSAVEGPYSGFPSQSSAEVDAATGQILNYAREQFRPDTTDATATIPPDKAINYATAKQKALYWVNLLYPDASKQLKLLEPAQAGQEPDPSGYSFAFQRYYNGIKVTGDTAAVRLGLDGDLLSYNAAQSKQVSQSTLPTEPSLTKDQAVQAFLDVYHEELRYTRYGGYYVNDMYEQPSVRLVYSAAPSEELKVYSVLDAETGKWVLTNSPLMGGGDAATEMAPEDVKGQPAEQDLMTLIRYHVLTPDEEGSIHPDAEISVGDWLTMMTLAVSPNNGMNNVMNGDGSEPGPIAGVAPDDKYFASVWYAARANWIDPDTELPVSDKLTREQFAVLLVNILKYSKLSAFLEEEGAASPLTDAASIQNKGAVMLALKLGLLEAEGGKFEPKRAVTKAEAAEVMMKLVKLQGRTDQKIGQ